MMSRRFATKSPHYWLAALVALLALQACKPEPRLTPNETNGGLPATVEAIFRNNGCIGCHGSGRRESGLALHTHNALLEGGAFGSVAFPNSAKWSALLWHVNHFGPTQGFASPDLMPYKDLGNGQYGTDSARLISLEDYNTLRNWIANGMPNRDGVAAWANRTTTGTGKLFFLNATSDAVGVLDVYSNLVMTYFEIGNPSLAEAPHYIAPSPDGQFVYMTLIDGGRVMKYRTDGYQLAGESSFLGSQPAHIELSADGRFAVVTNWVDQTANEDNIIILNAQTLEKVGAVRDARFNKTHGLALAPDFSAIYATNNIGNSFCKVSLNPQTGAVANLRFVSLDGNPPVNASGPNPYQCTLSPDGALLFITANGRPVPGTDSRLDMGLYMYDVSGPIPLQLAYLPTDGSECVQSVGKNPKMMRYHEGRLYVACWDQRCSATSNRKGCISVVRVDAGSMVWERNLYGIGEEPRGLAVDPVRKRLYVANSNLSGTDSPHHGVGGTGSLNWLDITNPANPRIGWGIPRDVAELPWGMALIP